MSAIVIAAAIVIGVPLAFVLAVLVETVCGTSPGQHYRNDR